MTSRSSTGHRLDYVVSNVHSCPPIEWALERLDPEEFAVRVFLIGQENGSFAAGLRDRGVLAAAMPLRSRVDIFAAAARLTKQFVSRPPAVVHAHLPVAGFAAMAASRAAGVPIRLVTRHNSTDPHFRRKRGSRLDTIANRLSTQVLAISEPARHALVELEKVPSDKVTVLEYGFDWGRFEDVTPSRVAAVRARTGLARVTGPIIGAVARFEWWKGVHHLVPAFKRVRHQFPDAHLVLANARGDRQGQIESLLARELPESSYTTIVHEDDIAALFKTFNVFVHVPIDPWIEAFGQVYLEALAAGVPSVFTRSGIALTNLEDGLHARFVPHGDTGSIAEAILGILGDPELQRRLRAEGPAMSERWSIDTHMQGLLDVYRRQLARAGR